jgi:peptidoglycan/LPS O-acetylase OafA/YrhL
VHQGSASYRPDIDGLRALAVLAVICFHAATRRVPGGFIGVDVFFVISGFLITTIVLQALAAGNFTIRGFYARRIRRIFPALSIVLIATWLGGWVLLDPNDFAALGRQMTGGAAFVSNILLWQESGYFDTAAALKPLLHLWSLGIEEQFYIFWPLVLTLVWPSRARFKVVLASVLLVSFCLNIWQTHTHPAAAFYLPGSRAWELLAGATLAYVGVNQGRWLEIVRGAQLFGSGSFHIRMCDVASLGGFLLIAGGSLVLRDTPDFPGWYALIPVTGAACVIAAGADSWINRTILASRPAVMIGLISYPLYLWHWPILVLARQTLLFDRHPKAVPAAAVGVAFFLSLLTYRLIELPVREAFHSHRLKWTALLCGALLAVASLGLFTKVSKGFPARLPPQVRALLTLNFSADADWRVGRCFLLAAGPYRAECTEPPAQLRSRPKIIIWGDSHGAMIYSSLNRLAMSRSTFVGQLTSMGCAPSTQLDASARPWCQSQNIRALKSIETIKPFEVVLSAEWVDPIQRHTLDSLPATVAILRKYGVKRIVLFGPVPHWDLPLPSAIARYMRRNGKAEIPFRMKDAVTLAVSDVDKQMAAEAASLGLEYVSPFEALCDADGCIASTDQRTSGITAMDAAHLTSSGAWFVISRSLGSFF